MHFCVSLACVLLALTVAVPASAGGWKGDRDSDPLVVLRGDLLAAGELDAPFADPGPEVGRFVLRSSRRADLRVDPGMARLSVPGGELRARAADPSEDVEGKLELCQLELSAFACVTQLPFPSPLPPIPLVPLDTDPDGLQSVLTDSQQALFGCGPFYGTVCDGTIVRPGVPGFGTLFGPLRSEWLGPEFRSELAVLSWNAVMALVALSRSDGLPSEGEFHFSDLFRTDGCSFAAPHFCTGVGGSLELCRLGTSRSACALTLPYRPSSGFMEARGIYLPPPVGQNLELTPQQQALLGCGPFYGTVCDDTALIPGVDLRAAGNTNFGRRDFLWVPDPDGPFYVRPIAPLVVLPGSRLPIEPGGFPNELAAASWNALMLLVAQTQSDGPPSEDRLDPSDPFRTDGCSFAAPHFCIGVVGFLDSSGWRFTELPDDPRGGARERWLWESATAYDIVHARGDLADFRDGRLYVYGPFESPFEGSASGVGLLLVPPEGVVPELTSPLVRMVPGLDRTFGTEDDSVVGFAWGAARSGFDAVAERRPKSWRRVPGFHGARKSGGPGRGRGRP